MSRYVDIENVKLKGISVFEQNLEVLIPLSDVRKSLQMTPTADVQEVKHGKWQETVPTTPKSYRRICSVCCGVAYMIGKKYSYCPYCGEKMDLEESDEKRI